MACLVLQRPAQPGTAVFTTLIILAWTLKKFIGELWYIVHIVVVQWGLCLLLYVFESRRGSAV